MKNLIRQHALELGFDDCRFTTAHPPATAPAYQHWLEKNHHGEMTWLARTAPKRTQPQLVLPGAQTLITLAASYTHTNPHTTNNPSNNPTGTIARYARYQDYHDTLAAPLQQLTQYLLQHAGPEHRALPYIDTGPILERDLAQRSGLGFIGKHTNLISRTLGNWIFLAEILTTLPLPPDPPEPNRCGTCTRCLTACPTQAITAPFQLDARLCISYLTIELKTSIPIHLRPSLGNRIYGCDECLAACPWNRFAREGALMKPHQHHDLDQPALLDLLALDPTAFKTKFKGTPILRTKRRGLLRNVCVALGNIADPTALPALSTATNDPEPIIAEHAHWAIQQITTRSINPTVTSTNGAP